MVQDCLQGGWWANTRSTPTRRLGLISGGLASLLACLASCLPSLPAQLRPDGADAGDGWRGEKRQVAMCHVRGCEQHDQAHPLLVHDMQEEPARRRLLPAVALEQSGSVQSAAPTANALARLTPAAGPTLTPPNQISRERHGQFFFSRERHGQILRTQIFA